MPVRTLIALLGMGAASVFAQAPANSGNEVRIILTSADHMNHRPPSLKAADFTVVDATVTGVTPIENGRNLELYIVMDDAADYYLGSRLGELHRFIAGQPEAVAVGVAYLHDGVLQVAEKPTLDHERAANALRAPSGSKTANPYCGISDLIDAWHNPADAVLRREIVLITSGVDATAQGGAICANAETAIHDAERAGVVLYALYNPVRNYASEKWSDVDAGIVHLAHVSYETGGEAYFTGHGPADSFAPFLGDITEHLANQYIVKFRLAAGPESGFQIIRVNGKTPDEELMAPAAVWVPAATAATGGN
jgi:hypothetical protein